MFRDFYNQHPIASWVFGIGAALVLAWAILGRIFRPASASSGDQYVTSSGPSDSQIAAATQIQGATIAAAADSKRADNELQLGMAQLSFANTQAVAKAQADLRALDLNYNLQTYGIASAERIDVAHTQASSDQFSLAAALQEHLDDNATSAQLEGIKQNAAVNLALIEANANSANLASNNAASVAKKQSSNGLLGGIISGGLGLLSIFSDARLKTNIIPVGRRKDGVIIYEWEYTAEAFALDHTLPRGRVRGVMAQQLATVGKHAAVTYERGFRKVDYREVGALA